MLRAPRLSGVQDVLLDQLLRDVDLDPEHDLYICNAIKCRPPNNRRPKKAELACLPGLA